jgi:hypothetical protein
MLSHAHAQDNLISMQNLALGAKPAFVNDKLNAASRRLADTTQHNTN